MAELRATQFFRGAITMPRAAPLFTVPAGRRYIIKCVTIKHESGTSDYLSFWLSGSSRIYGKSFSAAGTPGEQDTWLLHLVLDPANALTVTAAAGHVYDITVSGSNHFI